MGEKNTLATAFTLLLALFAATALTAQFIPEIAGFVSLELFLATVLVAGVASLKPLG
ncbi:MAG: hypothetical protein KAW41_02610 [Candidatus Diapherotrites archaeon]|nr:hypothetical protein [Candidatus Diapherotrites archaeon]